MTQATINPSTATSVCGTNKQQLVEIWGQPFASFDTGSDKVCIFAPDDKDGIPTLAIVTFKAGIVSAVEFGSNRRAFKRISPKENLKVYYQVGAELLMGQVRDISEVGLCLTISPSENQTDLCNRKNATLFLNILHHNLIIEAWIYRHNQAEAVFLFYGVKGKEIQSLLRQYIVSQEEEEI